MHGCGKLLCESISTIMVSPAAGKDTVMFTALSLDGVGIVTVMTSCPRVVVTRKSRGGLRGYGGGSA